MNDQARLLVRVQALYAFSTALASVFFHILLFKLGGLQVLVRYGLTTVTCLVSTYVVSGWTLGRLPARRLMQIGVLVQGGLYGTVLLLGKAAGAYAVPLGVLSGVAQGHYWAGGNLATSLATRGASRTDFFGRQGFWQNWMQATAPVVSGGLISLCGLFGAKSIGYSIVFIMVAICMALNFLLIGRMPDTEPVRFAMPQLLQHRRAPDWIIVLLQQFVYGLLDMVFNNISGVLLFCILKEEFALGVVNTLQTILVGTAGFVVGRILERRQMAFVVGMVCWPAGLLLFALNQNVLGIVCLLVLAGCSQPFLSITTNKALFDAIDRNRESWQSGHHFLVEREMALGAARILSYFGLLWFAGTDQLQVARTWVHFIPLVPFTIGMLQLYQVRLSVRRPQAVGLAGMRPASGTLT